MAISTTSGGIAPCDHVVHFYSSDEDLADKVGAYVLAALTAGDAVVVVGTAAHRALVDLKLAAAKLDPAACRSAGTYADLDAEETMEQFLVDGRPDRARFDSVIGGLIRSASANGHGVRVYGEMVALLWEAGHVGAAIELEELWNELRRELSFSLFCAYARESVAGESHAEAVRAVCDLHSGVLGVVSGMPAAGPADAGQQMRLFAKSLGAPREARRFVTDALRQEELVAACDHSALVDDAALVVTELAANAVCHADTDFSVSVSVGRAAVRIAVRDGSPLPPSLRDVPLVATSGRGLGIIATVSSRWAAESDGSGKVIWAELALPAPLAC